MITLHHPSPGVYLPSNDKPEGRHGCKTEEFAQQVDKTFSLTVLKHWIICLLRDLASMDGPFCSCRCLVPRRPPARFRTVGGSPWSWIRTSETFRDAGVNFWWTLQGVYYLEKEGCANVRLVTTVCDSSGEVIIVAQRHTSISQGWSRWAQGLTFACLPLHEDSTASLASLSTQPVSVVKCGTTIQLCLDF